MQAVECIGLGKRFGERWAVAGVDLKVEAGAVYGFLGRNGAGKTTLIRLLLGLLHPTTGSVAVFGRDVARERIAAARQVGALLEARATYDHLSGRENVDTTRRLLGLPASEVDRVIEAVDLVSDAHRKVGQYSLGMRQRIGLARAMLGNPKLLVLDEPMNGLDPDGIREMRDIIRALPERSGATVFMSSHLLSEVEQTATHIGLMHDGRLVLEGQIADMLRRAAPELVVRVSDTAKAAAVLSGAGFAPSYASANVLRLKDAVSDETSAAINRVLVGAGLDVHELSIRRGTLEDLYVSVQTQQREAA